MNDLIGHTVREIKVKDNVTIIYFESGMSLHIVVTHDGVKTQYYIDLTGEIIEL
jgi:hypothetical protein